MSHPAVQHAGGVAGAGAGAGTGNFPVQPSNQRSPVAIAIANYLFQNPVLKQRIGLFDNERDIEFFRFKRLVRALVSEDYKNKQANPKNGLVPITSEVEAQKVLVLLIQNQLILPVKKLHYAEVKAKRWKPNKSKPTLIRSEKAFVDPDAYYAWLYSKPNPYIILYSILAVIVVFAIILFPLWPPFMKRGVWYLSMAALGLIGLFFAIAIVRLIIYVISLVAFPKPFWLFPNLFEDCGVIESFQPVYAWEEPKKSKKSKKSKSKSKATTSNESNEASSSGVTSGAQVSNGSVTTQKRKVVLEEVQE
ncbi:subunit of ER protein translocation complex [Scheffersomyces amazonensis]|uniref:subunit of ER protein translocation complex n=1 Tax=Scheffersomyces amazonensis TaxID=1078765 RepID=UPI00315D85B3